MSITTKKPGAVLPPALAAVIGRAATTLPPTTGATQQAAARAARGDLRVVLADVSSSMAENAGALRKIDVLRQALSTLPPSVDVVAFSWQAVDVPHGAALPPPAGSTALHAALNHVAARQPTHVLVVSDGHPDNPRAALDAAARLSCQIDVIYCGPDGDREGAAFMRRLARGGGRVHRHSFRAAPEQLSRAVRSLALPVPK
ncbi:vWA domain-containing protein [Paracoccus sp. p3-h83]|uniref:vWA domain-containing protein n=1 Tax=Paracoccus sp. p3-h83 TaxID=3342805 RepID=UPI0035BB458C